MPVAFDLDRDSYGKITVGPETKIACNRALELAARNPKNTLLVVTAGNAGAKWDHVWMAKVMAEYLRSCNTSISAFEQRAKTFNTSGEMRCLADIVSVRPDVSEVVLVVKWWHAPRAKFLCRHWLKRYNLSNFLVTADLCQSRVGFPTIALEFIGAWPKNLLRLPFER